MDSITLDLDSTTFFPTSRENVSIFPNDVGGLNGIQKIGHLLFGVTILDYYKSIINYLSTRGYQSNQNLFGMPYDWRFGVAQPSSFFEAFQQLIEKSAFLNHQKAIIVSHSLGGYITNILLTEKTTSQWRKKFIDSVVMISPSWSGSGFAFATLLLQRLPFIPFYKTKLFQQMISSFGVLHIHVPNPNFFSNVTYFESVNGEQYKGDSVFKLIENTLEKKYIDIAQKNFEHVKKFPSPIDLPVKIIDNSRIQTYFGLKERKKGYSFLKTSGDGLVHSAGIEWACKEWINASCFDFKSSSFQYNHYRLLFSKKSIEMVGKHIFNFPNEKQHPNYQEL
jgi:hypothetical protein